MTTRKKATPDPVAPLRALCDYCRKFFDWPKAGDANERDDVIVGRSITGGHVCKRCYETAVKQERDYRDEASDALTRKANAAVDRVKRANPSQDFGG